MQAIAIPYTVDDAGDEFHHALRQCQSAAVRSAYANAPGRTEEELRDFFEARCLILRRPVPAWIHRRLVQPQPRAGSRWPRRDPDGSSLGHAGAGSSARLG